MWARVRGSRLLVSPGLSNGRTAVGLVTDEEVLEGSEEIMCILVLIEPLLVALLEPNIQLRNVLVVSLLSDSRLSNPEGAPETVEDRFRD